MNNTINARFTRMIARTIMLIAVFFCGLGTIQAQTTQFTYQGRLTDGGSPANGSYDLQVKLFDALTAGNQIGTTNSLNGVTVIGGVFTVTLDFGAVAFSGANRWAEISARPAGNGAFITLSPRQAVTSTPYAIKSLNAASADNLSAACTGCVTDVQVASVAGSKVTGAIPAAAIPAGSANYIQNATTQQANSNFNISGNGIVGGAIGVGVTTPNFPLSFPNTLGNKIALWGQSGANYGLGIQSSLLQLYTDNIAADIAFGFGSSAAFTETMRIRGNGNLLFAQGGNRTISIAPTTQNVDGNSLTIAGGSAQQSGPQAKGGGHLFLTGGLGYGSTAANAGGSVFVYPGLGTGVAPLAGNVVLGHDGSTAKGNVGVGTFAPTTKFQVNGGKMSIFSTDGGYGQLQIAQPNNGATDEATLTLSTGLTAFGNPVTAANSWGIGAGAFGLGGAKLVIGYGTQGPNFGAKLTIKNNGNVGIGITEPTAKLEVVGDIRSGALRQELTGSSPNVIGGFLGTGSGGAAPGNRVDPGVVGATIGGGGYYGELREPVSNEIITTGDSSNQVRNFFGTVGGGLRNVAGGYFSTVTGGYNNGTYENSAAIGGGDNNVASGYAATVPGGSNNVARGSNSFAAGQKAWAAHNGVFVWSDSSSNEYFESTDNNQFLIRVTGGVGIGTNYPAPGKVSILSNSGNAGQLQIGNPTSDGEATIGFLTRITGTGFGTAPSFGNQWYIGAGAYGTGGEKFALGRSFPGNVGSVITLQKDGSVGIGTDSPAVGYRLDVNGKLRATGFNGQCTSIFAGNGRCDQDIAETFATQQKTMPGDVVALIPHDNDKPTVRKAPRAYDDHLVGVVSTSPGLVFDEGETHLSGGDSKPNFITSNKTVVAVVGRAPVKFTLENGAINVGDPLTSSATVPGAAMKAKQAGKIIGYALESSAKAKEGKLLMWLQVGHYVPPAALARLRKSGASAQNLAAMNVQVEQQVAAQVQARTAELEQQIAELKSQRESNTKEEIMTLKAENEALSARLAALEQLMQQLKEQAEKQPKQQ